MARLVFCNDVNNKINNSLPQKKIPRITIDGRRKIVDKVKTLSKDVHMEIFYFLKKKINEEYTLNQNGVFVNLNNIDNDTLHELKKMVNFYSKNEKKLKESYLQRYCNKKDTNDDTNDYTNEDTTSNTSLGSTENTDSEPLEENKNKKSKKSKDLKEVSDEDSDEDSDEGSDEDSDEDSDEGSEEDSDEDSEEDSEEETG